MTTSYHVDEIAGSDDTGNGTEEQPYQSLGYALFIHGQTATLRIRKEIAWEEPTQSSLKKAKKTADGLEKKKKKAEEASAAQAAAQTADAAKREKLLEGSKSIVLKEDPSLEQATTAGA